MKLHKIFYHVYFMSCNLDHVLYGKLINSTDEGKDVNILRLKLISVVL